VIKLSVATLQHLRRLTSRWSGGLKIFVYVLYYLPPLNLVVGLLRLSVRAILRTFNCR